MTEIAARDWAYWTEPEWVEVDGLRTAYRRKGMGEPLLYLHGAGLTRTWLPLYETLSEHFDVIVPEHPGFGDTAMPDWLRGVDDLVLHYDGFLRALGIEGAHVVGHSLGGWIAGSLASFYPERFTSLTLITPIGLRVPEAPIRDPFRMSPEIAMDVLLSGAPPQDYLEYFQQGDEIDNTVQAYSEAITFGRLLWNPRYDLKLDHRLARVKIPTLVVAADDDRLIPIRHAERWTELIDGARMTVVKGTSDEATGHLLIIQRPDALAATIVAHAGKTH
ncbi:MAG TPA: alpha/beta fold hydrolase [Baekduia sp.]|nr:alpha/beta fold hydrolase [Baekduia sp.]